MSEANVSPPPTPAPAPAPAADPAPAPAAAPPADPRDAEIAALRKEAAENRVKAKKEAEAKEAAERQRLESEGKWKELFEKERAEREALAAKATKADAYESVFTSEVETLKKQLGDKAPPLDGVPLAQQLPILKQIAALAAGPGPVRTPTAGQPATHQPAPDLSRMSEEQKREYVRGMSPEQLRAHLASQGLASPRGSPWAWGLKKG